MKMQDLNAGSEFLFLISSCLGASAKKFHNYSLLFSKTGTRVILEVDNRDAKGVSWSAHVKGCIVPFLISNVEFED